MRHRAVGVVRDVADAEVVGDERVGEAEHRDGDERDRAVCAEARGLERAQAPVAPGRERDRERVAATTIAPRSRLAPNAGNVLPKMWRRLTMVSCGGCRLAEGARQGGSGAQRSRKLAGRAPGPEARV